MVLKRGLYDIDAQFAGEEKKGVLMKVQGKTIVVTGGGSGIGRELTLLLLNRGARVAAVDINETTLKATKALARNHQDGLSTHVLNITDRDAVSTLPAAVIQAQGAVDGVINNAGDHSAVCQNQ